MGTSSTKAGNKGKRPKQFLDHSAAQKLAASIAGNEEEKVQKKVGKLAQIVQSRPRSVPRISESKVKLKQTKALLALQQSETKKARKKRRKQLQQPSSTLDTGGGPSPAQPTKKRVTFA